MEFKQGGHRWKLSVRWGGAGAGEGRAPRGPKSSPRDRAPAVVVTFPAAPRVCPVQLHRPSTLAATATVTSLHLALVLSPGVAMSRLARAAGLARACLRTMGNQGGLMEGFAGASAASGSKWSEVARATAAPVSRRWRECAYL